MTAAEDLTRALLRMAERGQRPACGDGETSSYWTSEDADERALAATWCTSCPIAVECGAAAEEKPRAVFGVWAGTDYYQPPTSTRKRKTA